MDPRTALELIKDITKLGLIVAGLYVAFDLYVRRMQPAWSVPLQRRRLAILWALVLAASAIKVAEDVIGGESGPVDRAILIFIRGHAPDEWKRFFQAITLTGSSHVLVPLTSFVAVVLLFARRQYEALLLVASTLCGAGVVYALKVLVGRARPDLWPVEWYWGSSFPSGHTLVVSAFATAGALAVARVWPATREWAAAFAFIWVLLVALSRLVLGVHWPTDVLAAACIGATLPLAFSLFFEFRSG